MTKLNFNLHNAFAFFFDDVFIKPYLYALSKKMSEGHICLDLAKIPEDAAFWQDFDGEVNLLKVTDLLNSKLVSTEAIPSKKPFVVANNRLYLQRYYAYESAIIADIKGLIQVDEAQKQAQEEFLLEHSALVSKLALDSEVTNYAIEEQPDWQLIGALQAFMHNFSIITGGPGTGKTTTVAKIITLLYHYNPDIKIAIAAPTGKAAARMKESLQSNKNAEEWGIKPLIDKLKPATIHRLLGVIKTASTFKSNRENPLDFDVVIIDEASMIGTPLFSKLIEAIDPRQTKLLLLGDANQLASVDAGSLFGDICLTQQGTLNHYTPKTKAFLNTFLKPQHQIPDATFTLTKKDSILSQHIVELKKTYRYDTTSTMGIFTKALINGAVETVQNATQVPTESLVLDTEYDSSIFESLILGYTAYIEEENTLKALTLLNNIKVICAIKETAEGVYATNTRIEKLLKNHYDSVSKNNNTYNTIFNPSSDYYHNQPIIVTQNQPELGLYNGDIGIIRRSEATQILKAYFIDNEHSDQLKAISPGFITACETVFAMTIHKSQGSEFQQVLVILPKNAGIQILTRELLYTAVTRAKTKATIQGTATVLAAATDRKVERASGITERILKAN